MRIIFCGTPEYAVPSLERLAKLTPQHELVAVVSQPDRPKGRSRTPSPPPVVEAALKLGIPRERVFQPKSINKRLVLDALKKLDPDVLCVVAYGNLLKAEALALPKLHPINAHGSLLPRHRGAAPIQGAILSGDAETGVTIMRMALALDSGPTLLARRIPILPQDDAGTLHDKLAALSAEAFAEAVERIASGQAQFIPQEENLVTYVTKLEKTSGHVDWTKDAAYLDRFIRAMNPWPGAWTTVLSPDKATRARVRIAKATPEVVQSATSGSGSVNANEFVVGCSDGAIRIHALQPEGKREMTVAEFLRGAGRKFMPESRWE
jgi:methionyl-tRNA formyltransferase